MGLFKKPWEVDFEKDGFFRSRIAALDKAMKAVSKEKDAAVLQTIIRNEKLPVPLRKKAAFTLVEKWRTLDRAVLFRLACDPDVNRQVREEIVNCMYYAVILGGGFHDKVGYLVEGVPIEFVTDFYEQWKGWMNRSNYLSGREVDIKFAEFFNEYTAAERKRREEMKQDRLVDSLDTDEKRADFLINEYTDDETRIRILNAIESMEVLKKLDASAKQVSTYVRYRLWERLGTTHRDVYMRGDGWLLDYEWRKQIIRGLTLQDLCSLPINAENLKEWEGLVDDALLIQAIEQDGGQTLVSDLITLIKKVEQKHGYLSGEDWKETLWAADWLKKLYASGLCKQQIEAQNGMRINMHEDTPPVCAMGHDDFPAVYFEL